MTAPPLDEIDVGRDPRRRPPWHHWSTGRKRWVAAALVLVLAAATAAWLVLREPTPAPSRGGPEVAASAPGADVVVDAGRDTSKCPAGARCTYTSDVSAGVEQAFRSSFASAGYIGRQCVVDADTGEVYWQYIRFATGTLVTVTLSQQPVSQLAAPPVLRSDPDPVEIANGAVTLDVVRDGYLMSANAAGLPGQAIPVQAVRQWLATVPAPGR